jgi:hypothetical protein
VNYQWLRYIILTGALFCTSAFSQVTLTYQSATWAFTQNNVGNVPCPNVSESQDCLTFSITVPNLPPNLKNQSVGGNIQVNSMTFGPDQPIVSANISANSSFYFTTDATGKIIGWNFSIECISAAHGVTGFVGTTVWDYAMTTEGGGEIQPTMIPGVWTQPPPVVAAPPPPATVKVLNCANYAVIAPSATAIINVSPNASGIPSECKEPKNVPSTWYVKTTTNGGGTWVWTQTLAEIGL